MFNSQSSRKGLVIFPLALSVCLLAGVQAIVSAQSTPGLTLFSGIDREKILPYYLEWGLKAGAYGERYKLSIPAKKMMKGAAKFFITYPDYFDGKFKEDAIKVRVNKEPIELAEVIWDQESRIIEIVPEEQITASHRVEIVLDKVKNPSVAGTFYFNCQVIAANDLPIRMELGSWIITIES